MTGTGTQTDPYILMTAEDLYEAETVGGAEVYLKLGADIDFDKTQYAEGFAPIPLKCLEFDGNGHTIRNIYYTNLSGVASVFKVFSRYNTAYEMSVKNLRVENVYLNGFETRFFASPTTFEACPIYLIGCVISCSFKPASLLANSDYTFKSFMSDSNRYIIADLCTFILNTENGVPHSLFNKGSISRSQLRINHVIGETTAILYNRDAFFKNVSMSDTAIFGKISHRTQKEESNLLFALDGIHTNVYQAVEYENYDKVIWNAIIGTPCFYDSEVAGDRVSIYSSATNASYFPQNIYALTTAQCKDPEYLKSIGFICEGAE